MSDVLKVGSRTDDGAILAAKGWYYGARLTATGAAAGHVVVYDNASAASGTVIDELDVGTAGSSGEQFTHPIPVNNGIYLDVTTPGRVVVWYQG